MRYIDILQKAIKISAAFIVVALIALGFTVSAFAYSESLEYANTEQTNSLNESVLPEELFDIRLSVDATDITSTQQLAARAEFVSFGRVPTPVSLQWVVRDMNGIEVYRTKPETLVVETELTYPRRFVDMPKLPTGTYTLNLTTIYREDVVDEFSQLFTIQDRKDDMLPFLIIGFMVLVSIGWVVYFLMHHRGHIAHERMIAVTSRAAVFLIAGAVLPSAGLLMSERVDMSTQSSAVYMSTIGSHAIMDATLFTAQASAASEAYASLQKVIAYGDDVAVRAAVQELPVITALHILDEEKGMAVSMYRALGWGEIPSTVFAVPQDEGLVQANDLTWSSVTRFPRAEGGWYILQTSFDAVFTELGAGSYKSEDTILVNDNGTVITPSLHYKQGESLVTSLPSIWDEIQSNEYYEGVSGASQFIVSWRILVPTGTGYARYYLVTRGQHTQFSASVNFAF